MLKISMTLSGARFQVRASSSFSSYRDPVYEERIPARIADALDLLMVPRHIRGPQILAIDRVVLAHQHQSRLLMEVGSLASHRPMRLILTCVLGL